MRTMMTCLFFVGRQRHTRIVRTAAIRMRPSMSVQDGRRLHPLYPSHQMSSWLSKRRGDVNWTKKSVISSLPSPLDQARLPSTDQPEDPETMPRTRPAVPPSHASEVLPRTGIEASRLMQTTAPTLQARLHFNRNYREDLQGATQLRLLRCHLRLREPARESGWRRKSVRSWAKHPPVSRCHHPLCSNKEGRGESRAR